MAISINYFLQFMILRIRCNTVNCTLTDKGFHRVFLYSCTSKAIKIQTKDVKSNACAQNHHYAALNVYLDRNELKNTSQPTIKCYNNVSEIAQN